MLQHVICILGILLIAAFFVFLAVIVEPLVLDAFPPDLPNDPNMNLDQWIESFELWALVCVGAAAVASVFMVRDRSERFQREWWEILWKTWVVVISICFTCVCYHF